MKKIINNKVYDTATAQELATWGNAGHWGDFDHMEETLYRKKTGEYFLHGEGGARTQYAQATGTNEWSGGERIMPLTYEEARKWAEEHLTGEEYEAIFGPVTEDESRQRINLNLSAATVKTIKRRAGELGISVSAYVEKLVAGK